MNKNIYIIISALFTFNITIFAQLDVYDCYDRAHIWAIKKNQTGSGNTEVHVMSKNDSYQSYIVNVATPIEENYNGQFQFIASDYMSDFYSQTHPCLWAIKKWGTGSGHTEVHILDARTNFTTFINQTATMLPETNNDYEFLVGDYLGDNVCDLWVIKKSNTASGNFEIQILSGGDNFQISTSTIILPIQINCKDSWQFALGDYNRDGDVDLYMFQIYYNSKIACNVSEDGIKENELNGPISNIEIHIRDGSNLLNNLVDIVTPLLPAHYTKVQMLVTKMVHGICPSNYTLESDVLMVLKNGTGSGKTEAHVLNRLTDYTTFYFQTPTILHETYDNFNFATASFWYFTGDSLDLKHKNYIESDLSKVNNKLMSNIYNYPNPFNPSTKFTYNIVAKSNVSITIYDATGKEVENLVNKLQTPGEYNVEFNGSNYSSGIYFYKAILDNKVFVKKMLLLK